MKDICVIHLSFLHIRTLPWGKFCSSDFASIRSLYSSIIPSSQRMKLRKLGSKIFTAAKLQIIMPSLGWRWLLGLSTLPCFALLLFYVLIPETPRYLCNKGRTSEAQAVLEKVATLNGTKLPPGILVSDHLTDGNEEFALLEDTHLLTSSKKKTKESGTSSSLLVLFSPKLIRTTFLLWIVYFGNTFSYYGIILLTSELSSEQSTCSSRAVLSGNTQDSSLYINVFITSMAGIEALYSLETVFPFWNFTYCKHIV